MTLWIKKSQETDQPINVWLLLGCQCHLSEQVSSVVTRCPEVSPEEVTAMLGKSESSAGSTPKTKPWEAGSNQTGPRWLTKQAGNPWPKKKALRYGECIFTSENFLASLPFCLSLNSFLWDVVMTSLGWSGSRPQGLGSPQFTQQQNK